MIFDDAYNARTTIQYEFYNENDDLHENQKELSKLFGINYTDIKYTTLHTFEEIEELINFKTSGGKEGLDEKLKNRIEENGKGKYKYLDTYAYCESRGSYYIVYIQYKIEKLYK